MFFSQAFFKKGCMRKIILFLIVLSLIINIVNAEQKDVAYVVKSSQNPEFISALNDLSLSYDIIASSQISNTDFSDYEMILVGDEFFPNPLQFPVDAKNSLIVNTFHIDDWGISRTNPGVTASSAPLKIKNVDVNKWVTNNLPLNPQIYTAAKDPQGNFLQLFSLDRGDASRLQRYLISKKDSVSNPDHVIAVVLPGKLLFNNKIAQGRITFFGITETDFWTNDAKDLFKRTLLFTLNGNDADQDTFADVAVGGLDCNDNDDTIYPNAQETPYDGIDQDCDGEDLTDVDSDGFESTQVNGLDCNDNDPTISPNRVEILDNIDQNCVNDPPVLISQIQDIDIDEDSNNDNVLDLNDYFHDTDGDLLTFISSGNSNINLEITDNLVSINAINDFVGQQNIIFTASDNEQSISSNAVVISVLNINDAPFLIKDIEDLILDEDTQITLDLTSYFDDIDSNTLSYTVNGNENIEVTLADNTAAFVPDKDFFGSETITITASDSQETITSNEFSVNVNNINDKPFLIKDIEDLSWNEDESLILDLNNYFEDVDNNQLTFTFRSNSFILVNIQNNILELTSPKDWYGSDILIISASDSLLSADSNSININVNPVNDQPVISLTEITDLETNLPAVDIYENKAYIINVLAEDLDSEHLSFEWFLDSELIRSENAFIYTFDYNSQGSRVLKIIVKDEESETQEEIPVFVNNVNRKPYFDMNNEISVNEDETILIDINAFDEDNELLIFSAVSSDNIQCNIFGSKLEITPSNNFVGQETCTLTASDNIDLVETNILINVLEINDNPIITGTSPEKNQKIQQFSEISFNVEVEDLDNDEFSYEWFVNNNLESTNKDFSYVFTQPGLNEVVVVVSDNNDMAEYSWLINVIEKVNTNGFDGETTDLFNSDLSNIPNLILEKTANGKIYFLEAVSLGQNKDLGNNVILSNNIIAVNSQNIPELNKRARITLLHQRYAEPVILKSSQFTNDISLIKEECKDCRLISYTQGPTIDGTVIFEVPGFSSYAVKNSNNPNTRSLCVNGEKGDINLKLLEPDDDEINAAEGLKVRLKVNDEDDLIAKFILVDKDGDDIFEEKEDLDEKESEFLFDLEDVDEGDYTLFVKVYEDDNEANNCDLEKKDIEIERQDHEIIVNSFLIEPRTLNCNEDVFVTINLENAGKKSEDVNLNLYNNDLNLNINQKIKLEKYNKANKEKVFLNFKLPDNLDKEYYELKLMLDYGKNREISKEIKADKCLNQKQDTFNKYEFENPVENQITKVNKKEDNTVFLVANIIFLMFLIYLFVLAL